MRGGVPCKRGMRARFGLFLLAAVALWLPPFVPAAAEHERPRAGRGVLDQRGQDLDRPHSRVGEGGFADGRVD